MSLIYEENIKVNKEKKIQQPNKEIGKIPKQLTKKGRNRKRKWGAEEEWKEEEQEKKGRIWTTTCQEVTENENAFEMQDSELKACGLI